MNIRQPMQQVTLQDYLQILRRRKWTVILTFLIVVAVVVFETFSATPIYKATTRLIIEKENPNVVSFEEVLAIDAGGTDYYQTQYKLIESYSVAEKVIGALRLNDSEEFNPRPKDDVFSRSRQFVSETISDIRKWAADLFLSNKKIGLQVKVPTLQGTEPASPLVGSFIHRISVTPVPNSRLVDVSFEGANPVLVTRIVNELARAYIDQNLSTRLNAIQDAVKWLHERIDDERQKVEKAERALVRYKQENNIVTDFSSDIEQVTAQKLAQLNAQVVDAESQRVEAETRYRQARAVLDSPELVDSVPEVLQSPLIQQIKQMEVDLFKQLSELSGKYGANHPRMKSLADELTTIQKRKTGEVRRVINSLKNIHQVALAKEQSLKAAFEQQKGEILALNHKAIQYGVLRREAQSARDMYELLIKRFKEASMTEEMRTGNIRVIDTAKVPSDPYKPQKQRRILMAVMIGLGLGIGLALLFEYIDNTVKSPDDIKKRLQVPYLGPVPLFASSANGHNNGHNNGSRPLPTISDPKSTIAEAYRGVLTNLLFSPAETAPRVILITSPMPREGKSMTAANLGIALAHSGSRTIIVDCDFHRPKLRKIFNLERDRGLTHLIAGKGHLSDHVFPGPLSNLYLLPCGPIPPNPSEMLRSQRMVQFIEMLRKEYAYVIMDCAPTSVVTDPVLLSKLVDGVLVVIRAKKTPLPMAQNTLDQIQGVGSHVIGVVLNGVNVKRDGYYYYYQYYYYYSQDGDEKKKHRKRKRRGDYGYSNREKDENV